MALKLKKQEKEAAAAKAEKEAAATKLAAAEKELKKMEFELAYTQSFTNTYEDLVFETTGIDVLDPDRAREAVLQTFRASLPACKAVERNPRYVYHCAPPATIPLIAATGLRPSHGEICRGKRMGTCPDQRWFGDHSKGPDKSGQFRPVLVRSIHAKRVPVEEAVTGQSAAFALRSLLKKDVLKRQTFRKGMVMVDPALQPRAVREFVAEVVILHHATTIRVQYQAVVHCGVIRQSAQVREIEVPLLRAGDRGHIRFRFVNYGEYIKEGQTLLFREGRTKGLGKVVECL